MVVLGKATSLRKASAKRKESADGKRRRRTDKSQARLMEERRNGQSSNDMHPVSVVQKSELLALHSKGTEIYLLSTPVRLQSETSTCKTIAYKHVWKWHVALDVKHTLRENRYVHRNAKLLKSGRKKNEVAMMIVLPVEEARCFKELSLPMGHHEDSFVIAAIVCDQQKSVCSEVTEYVGSMEGDLLKVKKNTVASGKHHGSRGAYFSFGGRASYIPSGAEKDITIGRYALKSKKHPTLARNLEQSAARIGAAFTQVIERNCQGAVHQATRHLKTLHHASVKITKTCQSVKQHQAALETSRSLEMLKTSQNLCCPFSSATFCIQAETEEFHTETDCSATMICCPQLPVEWENAGKYQFEFDLLGDSKQGRVLVPLLRNRCCLFSAFLLSHRQQKAKKDAGGKFFNLAFYSNARYYHNAKRTLNRIKRN